MNSEDEAHNGAIPIPPLKDTEMQPKDAPISNPIEEPSKPTPIPSSAPNSRQEDLTTKVFQFLSTATPGTLGAVAAGLAAITYFILGQIGLLLIGAFAGITLFVSWEARHPEVSRAVRGEKGYDFLDRLFETRAQTTALKEQDEQTESQLLAHSFDDFQPETRDALNGLVDAVVRDYVDWWYGPIVPSDRSFPLSCRKVLTSFLLSVSNQLSRKRPADAFVDFLTNTCSIIIVLLSEITSAYSSVPSDNANSAADVIYTYLASDTNSRLSNLLNKKQQAGKFKMVAEDLLSFLDRPTYDCDPTRIFLREVLANLILDKTLQTWSKAEWINGWIVYLLESGETDLSQAIDDAIQDQKAFADVDGNFGNISLSKGNRSSYEMDRARKKEMAHRKKLSKADEEMERAMEEMKKLNAMIAEAEKVKDPSNDDDEPGAGGILDTALKTSVKELDLNTNQHANGTSAISAAEPSRPEAQHTPIEAPIEKPASAEVPVTSPIDARSTIDVSSQNSSPYQKQEPSATSRFTSFDQIVPPAQDEPDEETETRRQVPLTLHNASITIHDDPGNDKGRLRTKPNWEYLVQIEPASSQHPGWMAMKTYLQFESLHESLRRIATISGAAAFLEAHATFPSWKLHTRSSLRGEIERYLRAACSEKPLAESEAMKRFLEKGQDSRMGVNRGFSFESMGKGVLDVIQNAPKGALDGGKVVVGGVTGVFGNIGLGPRKSTISSLQDGQVVKPNGHPSSRPLSLSALPRMDTGSSSMVSRDSLDSQRSSVVSTQPGKIAPMERRLSSQIDSEQNGSQPGRSDRWDHKSPSVASSRGNSRASSLAALRSPMRSSSDMNLSNMKLPPPPNEMTDDYESPTGTRPSSDAYSRVNDGLLSPQTSFSSPSRSLNLQHPEKSSQGNESAKQPRKQYPPLTEQETRVAVELLFAVINELYTLSSAWNIRRTLLTAAKSFLIRPGNPSLISIQTLIQDTILEANTSDTGMATHLRKMRENSLPTEEELKAWPAELSAEEKEELRIKARKLFIQSGVPAALMGIMGQSATSEALGRVFDCLQVEELARGLFYGIILQAARVITH